MISKDAFLIHGVGVIYNDIVRNRNAMRNLLFKLLFICSILYGTLAKSGVCIDKHKHDKKTYKVNILFQK